MGIFNIGNEYYTERFMSTTSEHSIINNHISGELKPNQINMKLK
ncbi:hypothetical protein A1C_00060 [Rickettsia akari str. Hartford]|uniref:Uncharacterized protein n=1 Tax=Rickettsia akari (strain Hartford) TaxID=293614 RepID=A8GLS4_RICAH|nr:hypothetical protein A1C_00060 [Rickettsia akari str. Hartford]